MADASPRSPWPTFACVSVGVFMATLDSSIVHVTLPAILQDYGTTLATVEWVASIYLLVITGLLLAFGRLADVAGHRRVFTAGLATFTAGSALCATAGTPVQLIAWRALQGAGGAMLMACTPAIVTAVFPGGQRGRALGLVGTTVALGLTSGPPLGGLILGTLGWRGVFLINVPAGLVALALARKLLPPLRLGHGGEGYDLAGAVLFTAACSLFLLALNQSREWGATSLATVAVGTSALVFLLGFLQRERRAASPLVDLSLFRNRAFAAAVAAATLSYQAGFVAVLLLPFYLTRVRGMNPVEMGLLLTVPPLGMSVLAPLAGSLSDRYGYSRLTAAGLWVRAAAFLVFLGLGPHTGLPWLVLGLALLGAGGALFNPPNTSSIMGSVGAERLGTAGGIAAVARNLGMALGIATGGAAFSLAAGAAGGANLAILAPQQVGAFTAGWRTAMGVGLVLCLAAVAVSARRGRQAIRTVG